VHTERDGLEESLKRTVGSETLSHPDCDGMAGIDNVGSTARDFAMLERNLLSHVKLALMLSLVSFSVLLKARLVPEASSNESVHADARIPIASVQMVAALCALASGAYEYHRSFRDMLQLRAFLKGPECVSIDSSASKIANDNVLGGMSDS